MVAIVFARAVKGHVRPWSMAMAGYQRLGGRGANLSEIPCRQILLTHISNKTYRCIHSAHIYILAIIISKTLSSMLQVVSKRLPNIDMCL